MFSFLQHGDRLLASESDVYERQILTSKDSPRAERVKKMIIDYIWTIDTLGAMEVYLSILHE